MPQSEPAHRPSRCRATGSSPAIRRSRRRTYWPAARNISSGAASCSMRPVPHHRDAGAQGHRLFLVVRHVHHRRPQAPVQQRQLGARARRAAADRDSTAARRAETPAARARSRVPAPRAAAGRPTAARACDRAASRCPSIAAACRTRSSIAAAATRRTRRPNARFSRTLLCGYSA